MTDRSVPLHLLVLMGVSAGAYAVALAGAATLQSDADRAVTLARAPAAAAIDAVTDGHATLADSLARAAGVYERSAAAFERLVPLLDGTEAALDGLDRSVSEVAGAARDLPSRVDLPSVVRTAPVAKKATVHASTGASGG